jgi:hypothetical protein
MLIEPSFAVIAASAPQIHTRPFSAMPPKKDHPLHFSYVLNRVERDFMSNNWDSALSTRLPRFILKV